MHYPDILDIGYSVLIHDTLSNTLKREKKNSCCKFCLHLLEIPEYMKKIWLDKNFYVSRLDLSKKYR